MNHYELFVCIHTNESSTNIIYINFIVGSVRVMNDLTAAHFDSLWFNFQTDADSAVCQCDAGTVCPAAILISMMEWTVLHSFSAIHSM